MAYSHDDKYTDFEFWLDPYACDGQFLTSTAAFQAPKAMFHELSGFGDHSRAGSGGGGSRAGSRAAPGAGGAGRGGGAGPNPGTRAGPTAGVGGAGGKKRMGKKKGRGNARTPPGPPPPPPVTEHWVMGLSAEFPEEGHSHEAAPSPQRQCQRQRPPTPPVTSHWVMGSSLEFPEGVPSQEDGHRGNVRRGSVLFGGAQGGRSVVAGGAVAAAPPALRNSAGSEAGAFVDAFASGKVKKAKKKGTKKGKGSVQAPPSLPVAYIPSFLEAYFDDEYSEDDYYDGGYAFFDDSDDDEYSTYEYFASRMLFGDSDASDASDDKHRGVGSSLESPEEVHSHEAAPRQGHRPPPPAVAEHVVMGSSLEFPEEVHSPEAALPPHRQPERESPRSMTELSDVEEEIRFLGGSVGIQSSEEEFEDGHGDNARCESGVIFGGGGGGRFAGAGGAVAAAPAPSAGSEAGAGGNASACGKKKKKKKAKKEGKKEGKASVQALPSLPAADLPSLFGLELEDPLEEAYIGDEYSENDLYEGGYACIDDIDDDEYTSYENFFSRMHFGDSDDYDTSAASDDSDDEYMAHCLSKIGSNAAHSFKTNKPSSKSATQRPQRTIFEYCGKCKQSFGLRHDYLLHVAFTHMLCGACESKFQVDPTADNSGFDYKDHYKSSPSCLYNPKFKLGKVQITELLDFEEGERDQFICLTCGGDSCSQFTLTQHYATDHTMCRSCKIQFDTEDYLCQHLRTSKVHCGKYCLQCKMVFSSKEGFSAHCTETHSTGTNNQVMKELFTCDACTMVVRTFPTEGELEAHLYLEHIRCFPCKREFGQKKSLLNHLTASSQHNFCVRCDSDFTSSQSFLLHACHGKIADGNSED